MLTIIQSNRLEQLADILADRLATPMTNRPFDSEQVIVQSPGMSQWLKLTIAQHNGICSNVEFPLPSSFIWRLYQACIADLPEKSAFNKNDMAWKIHELLPAFLSLSSFQSLAHYLRADSTKRDHQATSANPTDTDKRTEDDCYRQFQLAEKIADVYDQYLVYRPEWILQWEASIDEASLQSEPRESQMHVHELLNYANYVDTDAIDGIEMKEHQWQPILWRALVAYTARLEQKPYHRANMHEQLINAISLLQRADANSDENTEISGNTEPAHALMQALLPSRLFIFGISALPLQQLQVFEALAQYIPVFIFQFNPCLHYWGDIVDEKRLAKIRVQLASETHQDIQTLPEDDYHQVGNPLLASLGKLGRDYFDMLLDTQATFFDAFDDVTSNNLLQHIQQDIYSLSFRGQIEALTPTQLVSDHGQVQIKASDESFLVSSCHSPLRECEVLQDHLLALFEQYPQLSPRDVLVMMPDVSQYSPAIEAVFNSQQEGMRIPFAISDRGITQENPLISSFLQLLQLPESRFTTTELFTLLEVPAVHEHLAIDENDLPKLQHWVREAGIRWGLDAQHKAQYRVPEVSLNTWAFGIRRLLLGYAVNSEQLTSRGVPYIDVEGQDTELLGRLLQFVQQLIHYRKMLTPAGTLLDKVLLARQMLSAFYQENDESQQALQAIRNALMTMETHVQQGNSHEAITHQVFFHCVQQELSEKGVGQRFLAGAVNFCTLMPMRSIPFKVICLLGMNERDYPRQVMPIGFDLVTQAKPKRGDRSRRLDDRYLFLEALLSARQQLYISYVGRSLQDNQPKLPSIVVSEVMDYCNQGFRFPNNEFRAREHALQPFNRFYFDEKASNDASHWFSYQKHWLNFLQEITASTELTETNEHSDSPEAVGDHSERPMLTDAPKMFGSPIDLPAQQWEISLDELLAFVQHPIRFYFQHTLSIRLDDALQEDNDDEAFELDGLQRFQLQQQLIKEQLAQSTSVTERFTVCRDSGQLPYQHVGEQQFQMLAEQSEHFVGRLCEVWSPELDPALVDLLFTLPSMELGGHSLAAGHHIELTGWLYHCQRDTQLFYRPAKIKATQWLTSWIQHLVLTLVSSASYQSPSSAAATLPTQTLLIGKESRITFPALTVEDARHYLQPWLAAFVLSKQRILHLLPETALTWLRKQSFADMQKVFQSNSFSSVAGEGDNVYVKQVIASFEQLPADFVPVSEQLLGPMWTVAEESAQ